VGLPGEMHQGGLRRAGSRQMPAKLWVAALRVPPGVFFSGVGQLGKGKGWPQRWPWAGPLAEAPSLSLLGVGRAVEDLAARLGSRAVPAAAPQAPRSTLGLLGAWTNGLPFHFPGEKEETNTGKAARFQLR